MYNAKPVNRYYDDLLGDVAHKIQLTPTAYKEAVAHFDAVSRFLDEDDSGFSQLDPVIYPQGSFRMGSTISAYDDRQDYDIDLILEAAIDPTLSPDVVLEKVEKTMLAGKGRLQFTTCEIKKRCVTLGYSNMHLDITPAVLVPGRDPRVITIFDRHESRPDHPLANPEGFASWFDDRVRPKVLVAKREVRAQIVPVPEQTMAEDKPDRLLAIQLLKRFRDIHCDRGGYDRCPSVLLSKIAVEAPHGVGLVSDLRSAAAHLAHAVSTDRIYIENPACPEDVLSDRWPKSPGSNRRLAEDLHGLVASLDELVRDDGTQVRKRDILKAMFGENAAKDAFAAAMVRAGDQSRAGGFATAKNGAVSFAGTIPAGSVAAPPHKFYGDDQR